MCVRLFPFDPFIGTTATLFPHLKHGTEGKREREILRTSSRRSGGGHVVKIVNTEKRWLYRHIDRHTFTHGAAGTRFYPGMGKTQCAT